MYDIEFKANGHKYEYEITADSAEIFKKNVDNMTEVEPIIEETAFIGVERAKDIALAHAGVTADKVKFDTVEWSLEKGSPVYEVEFRIDGKEYEYTIHAVTEKIIKHESDEKKESGKTDSGKTEITTEHITVEKAKEIALNHAGISKKDAKFSETELDFDHGVEVFEIEFKVGNTEYEYEINAKTGDVVKAEYDIDD